MLWPCAAGAGAVEGSNASFVVRHPLLYNFGLFSFARAPPPARGGGGPRRGPLDVQRKRQMEVAIHPDFPWHWRIAVARFANIRGRWWCGIVVPHDWTGEVEWFPKKVTIAADENEGILAPNGETVVVKGVQMKQTVLIVAPRMA